MDVEKEDQPEAALLQERMDLTPVENSHDLSERNLVTKEDKERINALKKESEEKVERNVESQFEDFENDDDTQAIFYDCQESFAIGPENVASPEGATLPSSEELKHTGETGTLFAEKENEKSFSHFPINEKVDALRSVEEEREILSCPRAGNSNGTDRTLGSPVSPASAENTEETERSEVIAASASLADIALTDKRTTRHGTKISVSSTEETGQSEIIAASASLADITLTDEISASSAEDSEIIATSASFAGIALTDKISVSSTEETERSEVIAASASLADITLTDEISASSAEETEIIATSASLAVIALTDKISVSSAEETERSEIIAASASLADIALTEKRTARHGTKISVSSTEETGRSEVIAASASLADTRLTDKTSVSSAEETERSEVTAASASLTDIALTETRTTRHGTKISISNTEETERSEVIAASASLADTTLTGNVSSAEETERSEVIAASASLTDIPLTEKRTTRHGTKISVSSTEETERSEVIAASSASLADTTLTDKISVSSAEETERSEVASASLTDITSTDKRTRHGTTISASSCVEAPTLSSREEELSVKEPGFSDNSETCESEPSPISEAKKENRDETVSINTQQQRSDSQKCDGLLCSSSRNASGVDESQTKSAAKTFGKQTNSSVAPGISKENSTAVSGPKKLLCSECARFEDEKEAEYLCSDCRGGSLYCADCCESVHARPKLRDHKYENLKLNVRNTKSKTFLNEKENIFSSKFGNAECKDFVQPWHEWQPNLFQILQVVLDQSEYSVVEKVIVSEKEVVRLGGVLALDKFPPGSFKMNFADLADSNVTVIGLTGNDQNVHLFLHRNVGLSPRLTYETVCRKKIFPPGLYALMPNKRSLFLFYWKSGEHSTEIENESIRCQMLRHIYDFSHEILVCLKAEDISTIRFPRFQKKNERAFRDVKVEYEITEFKAEAKRGFHAMLQSKKKEILVSHGSKGLFVCTANMIEKQLSWFEEKKPRRFSETSLCKEFNSFRDCNVTWQVTPKQQKENTNPASEPMRDFLAIAFPEISQKLASIDQKVQEAKDTFHVEETNLRRTVDEEEQSFQSEWENAITSFFKREFIEDREAARSVSDDSQGEASSEEFLAKSIKDEMVKEVLNLRRVTQEIQSLAAKKVESKEIEKLYSSRLGLATGEEAASDKHLFLRFFDPLINFFKRPQPKSSLSMLKEESPGQVQDFLMPTNQKINEMHLKFYRKIKNTWIANSPYDRQKRIQELTESLKFVLNEKLRELFLKKESLTKSHSGEAKFGNGSLQLVVTSFIQKGKSVFMQYKSQYYEAEQTEYSVALMQLTNTDVKMLASNQNYICHPLLSKVNGANFRLPAKVAHVRALYCLRDSKKALLLAYFSEDEKMLVYIGEWRTLTKKAMKRLGHKDITITAFDEEKRLLALWDGSDRVLAIYEFTEFFVKVEYNSDCNLSSHFVNEEVRFMKFLFGKEELLFVDGKGIGRIYNIKRGTFYQGHLRCGPTVAAVETYFDFVVVISKASPSANDAEESIDFVVSIHSASTYKAIAENVSTFSNASSLSQFRLVQLRSQVHLIAIDPKKGYWESILLSLISPECNLVVVSDNSEEQREVSNTNSLLEDFYTIFRKYPIVHCYQQHIKSFQVTFHTPTLSNTTSESLKTNLQFYFRDMFRDLQKETGKPVRSLIESMRLNICVDDNLHQVFACLYEPVQASDWMLSVVTAVPIQIARAENNVLLPLSKGIGISLPSTLKRVADVIDSISFGLFEAVLKQSTAPVKIVSAMGKQSAGKSFLLNHVTGAQFDIAGGRCTHGIWMSVKLYREVTLIALDFEGLGSFERSRQEDMLMAVFGAAVSTLTVFKTGPRFDEDTKRMFDRFQDGATLLKQSDTKKQLFKGKLYVVCRDVSCKDADEVQTAMIQSITDVLHTNRENNFVKNLYRGFFRVAASEPFGCSEFLQSFVDIKEDLGKMVELSKSALVVTEIIKTLLAKVYLQDWTALDRTRINQRLAILEQNMESAVFYGAIMEDDVSADVYNSATKLCKFGEDNQDSAVPDEIIEKAPNMLDFTLELNSNNPTDTRAALIDRYIEEHKHNVGLENWCKELKEFLDSLVSRRIRRVKQWILTNTESYQEDNDVKRLFSDAENTYFNPLSQLWSLCKQKCKNCFRFCLKTSLHNQAENDKDHHCFTNHQCRESCSYCTGKENVPFCSYSGGHPGKHKCKESSHTCNEVCDLAGFEGCLRVCTRSIDHESRTTESGIHHRCDAEVHFCASKCSSPNCNNFCSKSHNHEGSRHECSIKCCTASCCMDKCNNRCSSDNHFHSLESETEVVHICGNEHSCQHDCEYEGVCTVETSLTREQKTVFKGRYDEFEFVLLIQQEPQRKKCAVAIPAGQKFHHGRHSHFPRTSKDQIHFCNTRCPTCENFCTKEFGHSGRHKTNHSNMINQIFVAEDEEFKVGQHTYGKGESAQAEMCDQFCKRLGRGHTHILRCPGYHAGQKDLRVKHGKTGLGPHRGEVLDEVTHDYYWYYTNFEDNCTSDERELFTKCSHFCSSRSKKPPEFGAESEAFCQLNLWHEPKSSEIPVSVGHVSKKGHHFHCKHENRSGYHTVLVLDKSGSMSASDKTPTMQKLKENCQLNNRLGAVLETCDIFCEQRCRASRNDVISLITFDSIANLHWIGNAASPGLVDTLLSKCACVPSGGTRFVPALVKAKEAIENFSAQNLGNEEIIPVVILLSDGDCGDKHEAVEYSKVIQQSSSALKHPVIYCIHFGDSSRGVETLRLISSDGTVHRPGTAIQLKETFKEFHEKMLRGTVGVMKRN